MSTSRPPPRTSAHALLVDQTGRVLFAETASGAWALPATELTFTLPPYRQVVTFARQHLGVETTERDLLLAHVSAYRASDRSGLGLVVSVGRWDGDPTPNPETGPATRRWFDPGDPPARLAAWDASVLPSLTTDTPYAELGWADLRGTTVKTRPADSQRAPGAPDGPDAT